MWGYDWYGDARTVDVHIAQVRKKVGDGSGDQDGAGCGLPARIRDVSRPRRRLRTRLLVAMVGIAFGVLVVSTLGAIGLAKRTAADSTLNDVHDRRA